jgi:hypothetical protein
VFFVYLVMGTNVFSCMFYVLKRNKSEFSVKKCNRMLISVNILIFQWYFTDVVIFERYRTNFPLFLYLFFYNFTKVYFHLHVLQKYITGVVGKGLTTVGNSGRVPHACGWAALL